MILFCILDIIYKMANNEIKIAFQNMLKAFRTIEPPELKHSEMTRYKKTYKEARNSESNKDVIRYLDEMYGEFARTYGLCKLCKGADNNENCRCDGTGLEQWYIDFYKRRPEN